MIKYLLFLCLCTVTLFFSEKATRDAKIIKELQSTNSNQEILITNLRYEISMCKMLYTGKIYKGL